MGALTLQGRRKPSKNSLMPLQEVLRKRFSLTERERKNADGGARRLSFRAELRSARNDSFEGAHLQFVSASASLIIGAKNRAAHKARTPLRIETGGFTTG